MSPDFSQESQRLFSALQHVGWNKVMCDMIAPVTAEILALKRKRNAVILAHSYQSPEIIHGIADFVGDSYELAKKASDFGAYTIVFCGVRFMAETAKILNPEKTVLLPATEAGCSLADAVTPDHVRALRKKYPKAAFVCYVNTTAAVKAECDACCTSANALTIIEALSEKQIVFLPDEYMAQNLAQETRKEIIGFSGRCIVHETFSPEKIALYKRAHPEVKILAHTECAPAVCAISDLSGGTGGMIRYVRESGADDFMLVTECGLSDRLRMEFPHKRFLGMCGLCPYMKMTTLQLVRDALQNPRPEQCIEIAPDIQMRARRALERMFALAKDKTPTLV